MFVQYLNERQQGALLHYAHEVMRASGSMEAEEMAYLNVLRTQALPGVEAEDVPIGRLSELFDDRLSSVALLLELVGMGYADDKFDPKESALIKNIITALAIDEESLLEDVQSWVRRQLLLVKEAHQLMEG